MGEAKIVIVDYGLGNLGSIRSMLKHLGYGATISSQPDEIGQADKLILAGVGAFDAGIVHIEEYGLSSVLNRKALEEHIPILGICLGMQLLGRRSEEGQLPGLGWIEADTIRFAFPEDAGPLKIPHMGWNTVNPTNTCCLFTDMPVDCRFYFVHSYHLVCDRAEDVVGITRYGLDFASVVAKDNIYGAQFHPEKSHRFGMTLLRNFVELA